MTDVASASAQARQSQLDRVLDSAAPNQAVGEDLWRVVDLMDAEPGLRRAATDPGYRPERRQELLRGLLGGQIGDDALRIVIEGAGLRWNSGRGLSDAIERQGVRAILHDALGGGVLDTVEDELFHLERAVDADPELRDVLADRRYPQTARADLVADLLGEVADRHTVMLARRAVGHRERTFGLTIEHYLTVAADLRNRSVAHVVAARPLTREQEASLRERLSRHFDREVDIQVEVDPDVVGGLRVHLGDYVIDGTVAHKIDTVRRQLG